MKNQEMQSIVIAIKSLISGYVIISIGALLALFVLRDHQDLATQEAWVHGIIVATTSILMALFTRGMLAGKVKAYLRLRITTAIMFVAIVITTAIPGDFPMWMKVEQIVCGVLLLSTVIILNSTKTRHAFMAE